MRSLANIKAVTFDVGGTLIKPQPSVGHVYAEVAAKNGCKNVSPDELNRQFKAAWRGMKTFNHRREEWAELVDKTFAGLVKTRPSTTFFPELYDRFSEPEAWRIFEDVAPTLDYLASQGIGLGIISNWDERLRPLLERLGLARYFEAIIVSCEVGFPKPSPVIFQHAAKKLGLAPEFILHVGDCRRSDAEGAKSAGFAGLLLDREREEELEWNIGSLWELERRVG